MLELSLLLLLSWISLRAHLSACHPSLSRHSHLTVSCSQATHSWIILECPWFHSSELLWCKSVFRRKITSFCVAQAVHIDVFFFYPVPVNFPQEAYALQTSLPFFSGALHYGYRATTADSPEMVRSVELFCAVRSLQSFQGQKPLKAARFFQCFTWKAFSYYLLKSWLFYPKIWPAARGMESSVERGAHRPSCDSWLTLYKHYHIRQEWKRKKEKIH